MSVASQKKKRISTALHISNPFDLVAQVLRLIYKYLRMTEVQNSLAQLATAIRISNPLEMVAQVAQVLRHIYKYLRECQSQVKKKPISTAIHISNPLDLVGQVLRLIYKYLRVSVAKKKRNVFPLLYISVTH